MATSGSYSFSVTRDDIIREAMLNIGKLGGTEAPTAQETTDCARKLNLIVKQWMGTQDFAPGLKMWTRQRGDLFLSSVQYQYALGPTTADDWAAGVTAIPGANYGQSVLTAGTSAGSTTLTFGVGNVGNFTAGDYVVVQLATGDVFSTTIVSVNSGAGTILLTSGLSANAASGAYVFNYTTKGQRPLSIVTAILRDTTYNDTPLDYMTLQTYEQLPNKVMPTFQSDPTAIYYEPQIGSSGPSASAGNLYIDCGGAQDVTKHIHIVYLRPVQDFVNPTDNPEYPQEWYRALCWGLSKEICPMFNAPWTREMGENYLESLLMARSANSETTDMYFQPNTGNFYGV